VQAPRRRSVHLPCQCPAADQRASRQPRLWEQHFAANTLRSDIHGPVGSRMPAAYRLRRSEEQRAKSKEIVTRLKAMKLKTAAELVEQKASETLTFYAYSSTHWRQIRTNNPLERIIREIRRRTRVVGAFPHGHSALMLTAARLRHIASTKWGKRRYRLDGSGCRT
jgi:transposase-like protein